MTPIVELRLCGYSGTVNEVEQIRELIARHAKLSHGRKQKLQKRICGQLGLACWPGRGVFEAILRGDDYVSPSMAGIVMHAGLGGLPAGDADAYHFAQIADLVV